MKKSKTNRTLFRGICAVLAICLSLGMAGCGGSGTETGNTANPSGSKNTGSSSGSTAGKNAVFHAQSMDVTLDYGITSLSYITKAGDRIYAMGYGDDGSVSSTYLVGMNVDGTDVTYQLLNQTEYYSYDYDDTDIDESALSSAVIQTTEEETTTEEDITDEEEVPYVYMWYSDMASDQSYLYLIRDEYVSSSTVYQDVYSLVCLDCDGNELWTRELGSNGNSTDEDDVYSYFYCSNLMGTDNGVMVRCYQDDESTIVAYDSQGNPAAVAKLDIENLENIIRTSKGTILLEYMAESDYTEWFATWDSETGALGEPFKIPDARDWNYEVQTNVYGGSYDIYYTSNGSLYGYQLGAEASVEIMNFVDSDIDSSYLGDLIVLDDETLLMTEYDYSYDNYAGRYGFYTLTKVAPEDVVDKTILQLATYGLTYYVRSRVIAFNKNSDTYRIRIVDYSSYDTDEDTDAGIRQFNNDIIAGNGADIIFVNDAMNVSSLINKGALQDLYPFMDQDPDITREDYLQNILDTYSVDGKLYQLVPSFNIQTLMAKSSRVGENPGWTVQDMIDCIQSARSENPDVQAFDDIIASDFLSTIINYSGDQWIDWENATCNFNSESFIDLLEFSNTLPKDYSDYEDLWNDENYWSVYESRFRQDAVLFDYLYLYNFNGYQSEKYGTFGEDVTLIGYPVEEGNGAVIDPDCRIAMSASSKNQEGAWSFIREYLLDDYQSTISGSWPLSVKQMNAQMEEATQKPYYLDEDGNKVEYDRYYWVGDERVVLPTLTEEEIAEVYDVISNASVTYHYDVDLMNIITEEVEAFYSGQKTAAAVADIIQSRASIYISENQ
jgi:ABC-type glycerol-3-phosphate transport system substrate-binding protein